MVEERDPWEHDAGPTTASGWAGLGPATRRQPEFPAHRGPDRVAHHPAGPFWVPELGSAAGRTCQGFLLSLTLSFQSRV